MYVINYVIYGYSHICIGLIKIKHYGFLFSCDVFRGHLALAYTVMVITYSEWLI